MEKIKKKKTILIIIFSVLLITIAGTFAYLTWTKKIGRLVLRIGDLNTTEVRVSPYIIEGSFSPTLTYTGNTYTSVRVMNNKSEASKIILYYDIKNIDSALVSQYMKYMITKSESLNGTYTEYTSGNFSSVATGEMMEILRESVPANTIYYYRVYLWIDGTTGNQNDMIGKNISLNFYAKILESTGATLLIDKANMESLLYGSATDEQKKEMWAFSHEATEQTGATTDYRYIGSNPNNYIIFNGETWRIIGVFDGRIKLVKGNSLPEVYWDTKPSGYGSSLSNDGSNDWTDSQLMYMLNSNWLTTGSEILKGGYTFDGTYVKDSSGQVIYKKGCRINAGEYPPYDDCYASTWSLNSTSLEQIDKVTYYLGIAYGVTDAPSRYSYERGTSYLINNNASWNGYVGLPYSSDYSYTFAKGVDDALFAGYLEDDDGNVIEGVPTTSWMYNMVGSNDYSWLISPNSDGVDTINSDGMIYAQYTGVLGANSIGTFPTVYLKANTKLQGNGTESAPYTIVEDAQPGSDMLVSKSNVESLTYANATDVQKKEMWAFSHPATSQVGATTDYRYIGSNPNNYIIFNGETWRIIGVFDGKIKIIRQDSLGELYWDIKKRGVGSSTSNNGSNDWTDSQLMYMLNSNWLTTGSEILKTGNTFDGTYVKDSNGKIIYQKGCLPAGASGTTYTCTSNTWSLNNTASSQVEKVTYYLGGSSKASSSGPESYAFERGVNVPTNRPTNWSGYVGLSYPSDYIYTFANGVDDTCFNNGYNCDYSNANPTSSWMKLMYTSGDHWFISPQRDTSDKTFILHGSKGNIWYYSHTYKEGVRPTVYLKANIKLQGDGTNSNPYQIQ